MPLRIGSTVRIDPDMADELLPPFSHYARMGRVGVITEVLDSTGWQISFASDYVGGKPKRIVLRRRDVIETRVPRPGATASQQRAPQRP